MSWQIMLVVANSRREAEAVNISHCIRCRQGRAAPPRVLPGRDPEILSEPPSGRKSGANRSWGLSIPAFVGITPAGSEGLLSDPLIATFSPRHKATMQRIFKPAKAVKPADQSRD